MSLDRIPRRRVALVIRHIIPTRCLAGRCGSAGQCATNRKYYGRRVDVGLADGGRVVLRNAEAVILEPLRALVDSSAWGFTPRYIARACNPRSAAILLKYAVAMTLLAAP